MDRARSGPGGQASRATRVRGPHAGRVTPRATRRDPAPHRAPAGARPHVADGTDLHLARPSPETILARGDAPRGRRRDWSRKGKKAADWDRRKEGNSLAQTPRELQRPSDSGLAIFVVQLSRDLRRGNKGRAGAELGEGVFSRDPHTRVLACGCSYRIQPRDPLFRVASRVQLGLRSAGCVGRGRGSSPSLVMVWVRLCCSLSVSPACSFPGGGPQASVSVTLFPAAARSFLRSL